MKQIPNVSTIIYINNNNNKSASEKFDPSINLLSLNELEEIGARQKHVFDLPKAEDVALIMYTSGTTGNPKAVSITHKQVMASIRVLLSNTTSLSHEAERHVYMSFLPLAHILGFTFEAFLFSGKQIFSQ